MPLSIIHFCDTVWIVKLYILQIYLENVKSFDLKYKNFLFKTNSKSPLYVYINLDFLQFHLISAKIYISKIYEYL